MWRNKKPDISFDITTAKDGSIKVWVDGTNEFRDLKVTLKGCWPWNKFHRGAVLAARDVAEMLDEADYLKEDYVYYIGGHSMGGAIARELADMLEFSGYEIKECITYGAYGTGTKGGQWKETNYRNRHDIVPFIFPWWILKANVLDRKAKWPFRFVENHKHYNKDYWKSL